MLIDYHNQSRQIKIGDSSITIQKTPSYKLTNWGFIIKGQDSFNTKDKLPLTDTVDNGKLHIDSKIVGSNVEFAADTNPIKAGMVVYVASNVETSALFDDKQKEIVQGFRDNGKSIIVSSASNQHKKSTAIKGNGFYIFPAQFSQALPKPDGSADKTSHNKTTLEHAISLSMGLSYTIN